MTARGFSGKVFEKVNQDRAAWTVITVTLLAVSVFIISKGAVLGNDSYSYMHMYVTRPPGYPLYLAFLKLFTDHYLMLAVIVQTLLNAAVFLIFIRYLCEKFSIQPARILLILPFIVYFFIEVVEPENILTESIAFPLFLILSIYFIDSIISKKMRGLFIALGINVLLVLIRGQFLFVFPLVALGGAYVLIRNRNYLNTKYIFIFLAALVISYGSTSLINRTYHYIAHDTFSDTQSYMSFIRSALYISDKEDYLLFEDELHQEIHREMYDSLYSAGLNADAFYDKINPAIPNEDRRRSDLVIHYHESLKTIAHILLGDLVRDNFEDLSLLEYEVKRDELFKEFSKTLIKENFSLYSYIVTLEILVYGFIGNRTFLLIVAIFFIISFIGLIRENKFSEVLFFFVVAHFLNLVLMALSNRVLGRYMIYNEFVIVTLLLVLFIKMMMTFKRHETIYHQDN